MMKKIITKSNIRRFVLMLAGIFVLGFGISLLRLSGFGTDPFSCMNIGISGHLPISYGTYQLIVNIVLFIPVIILYPKSFGIGAFVNMIGVAYIADFCMWVFGLFKITVESCDGRIVARIVLLLLGLVFLCLGVALYMECDLGVAPYDMLSQVIEDASKGRIKFKWARVGTDIICITAGLVSGGTVGIATIVTGFFTGPLVSWFRKNVALRLLGKAGRQAE